MCPNIFCLHWDYVRHCCYLTAPNRYLNQWWLMIIIITTIIMSVFYSTNFNSDSRHAQKRLWYQTDTRQKLGKYTQYDRNVTSQLWICNMKQMCLQTALENVNGLSTLVGDGERVPERRSGMRKTMLAKTFHLKDTFQWNWLKIFWSFHS